MASVIFKYFISRSVVATKDIFKGDEIFVEYNYEMEDPTTQEWYRQLYEIEVGPLPCNSE